MKCQKCDNVFTDKKITVAMVEGDWKERIICPACGSNQIEF